MRRGIEVRNKKSQLRKIEPSSLFKMQNKKPSKRTLNASMFRSALGNLSVSSLGAGGSTLERPERSWKLRRERRERREEKKIEHSFFFFPFCSLVNRLENELLPLFTCRAFSTLATRRRWERPRPIARSREEERSELRGREKGKREKR